MSFDRRFALALLITGVFAGAVFAWWYEPPSVQADAIAAAMLGALATAFGTVVQYYFGSSDGSKKKDDALMEAAVKPNSPSTVVEGDAGSVNVEHAQPNTNA